MQHDDVSTHEISRAADRALRPEIEGFLMDWGTETMIAGVRHLTLVRRDLPAEVRKTEQAAKASGWILIIGKDGSPIRSYRRSDAWRCLRRETEMRPRHRCRQPVEA